MKPSICLINGLNSDWSKWARLMGMLSGRYSLHTYEPNYARIDHVKVLGTPVYRPERNLDDFDLLIGHSAGGKMNVSRSTPYLTIASPLTQSRVNEFHIGNRSDPVVPRAIAGHKDEWRYGTHSEIHEKYLAYVLIPKIFRYGINTMRK